MKSHRGKPGARPGGRPGAKPGAKPGPGRPDGAKPRSGRPFPVKPQGGRPQRGAPPGGASPSGKPPGARPFAAKPRQADRRSERDQAGGRPILPGGEPAGEVLFGVHPVMEALRVGGRPIERVFVSRDRHDSRVAEAHRHARERGIPVQYVPVSFLDRMSRGGNHQGLLATVGAREYAPAEELIEKALGGGILLAIDGVQDPRNLGAILRTAAACGVRGVFIPVHGASGLTPLVARAAAGGMERIPVARVTNIAALIPQLQERGFTAFGLDAGGEQGWAEPVYPERTVLVLGGEEGLRELVRKRCDHRIRIPMAAGTESLNVSVAAAVALYEMVRQREVGEKGRED